jgi:hypothetical protein
MGIRALGSIVRSPDTDISDYDLYLKLLDGHDHWKTNDPRLAKHYDLLSRSLEAFAYDILGMSVVAHEILGWLDKLHSGEEHGAEVVTVGTLTEAYILSARTACDALAFLLGEVVPLKKGQAPKDSLRGLVEWAKANASRIDARAVPLLTSDFGWFYRIRSLRDRIIHDGCFCNIHTDRHQFNLWVHSHRSGWITREPLFPLLASMYTAIATFSDKAADVIYAIIELPEDRRRSRVLSGIRIPALKKLVDLAPDYSKSSP